MEDGRWKDGSNVVNPSTSKRPLSLTLFAVWIAILSVISLTRAFMLFQQIPVQVALGLPANWTMAILSAVWGAGLLAGAVGLWLRWEPARWAVLFLVPAYYLTHWLYWKLSARADYARGQIGPYTIFVLLVIAYSTWFLTWRRTRQQFQR
jgi:uncharacterized membrane protein